MNSIRETVEKLMFKPIKDLSDEAKFLNKFDKLINTIADNLIAVKLAKRVESFVLNDSMDKSLQMYLEYDIYHMHSEEQAMRLLVRVMKKHGFKFLEENSSTIYDGLTYPACIFSNESLGIYALVGEMRLGVLYLSFVDDFSEAI